MRIAVVATYDVTNIKFWSGNSFYLFKLLRKRFNVDPVKIKLKRPIISFFKGLYYNRILKKRYFTTFDLSVHKKSIPNFKNKLLDKYDVIFTYEFFLIPSLSNYAKHVILISDATFDNLLNYYDYRSNLCTSNIRDGHILQKLAFEKVRYVCFSSNWAISNAIHRYGADKNIFKTLVYGSNLSRALKSIEIDNTVNSRLKDDCIKFLFPAVYWERKGGDYAIEVINALNARGYFSKLFVTGCKDQEKLKNKFLENVGFLDKRDPKQERLLINLYLNSHFLILPSKADCTPIVFSEANSFALPILTTKTGGIPSMVNEKNNNGITFELDENYVRNTVEFIIDTLKNKNRYKDLCFSSHETYKCKFNWSIGEAVLNNIVESFLD